MLTWFSENGEILYESHNIRLTFQKVKKPILTQIKSSFQISYDLDQSNTVAYDYITNSLEAEAAIIGDHTNQIFRDVAREFGQGRRWRDIYRVLPKLV